MSPLRMKVLPSASRPYHLAVCSAAARVRFIIQREDTISPVSPRGTSRSSEPIGSPRIRALASGRSGAASPAHRVGSSPRALQRPYRSDRRGPILADHLVLQVRASSASRP